MEREVVRFAFIRNYLMTDKWKDFFFMCLLMAGQQSGEEQNGVRARWNVYER